MLRPPGLPKPNINDQRIQDPPRRQIALLDPVHANCRQVQIHARKQELGLPSALLVDMFSNATGLDVSLVQEPRAKRHKWSSGREDNRFGRSALATASHAVFCPRPPAISSASPPRYLGTYLR